MTSLPSVAFAVATAAPLVAAVALAQGCGSSAIAPADATADYMAHLPQEDGGDDGGDAAGGDATVLNTVSALRIAHLSPDLPEVDFCWRIAGSVTYTGPVLSRGWAPPAQDAGEAWDAVSDAADADATSAPVDAREDAQDARDEEHVDAGDAGDATMDAEPDVVDAGDGGQTDAQVVTPPGLSYGEVTSTIQLDTSGTFDFALVPAGSKSCDSALFVGHVTLDAGKHATVAVVGLLAALQSDAETAQALSIVSFTDDGALDPQNARLRIVHAALGWPAVPADSPAPQLSVDVGSREIAAEVDPKHASATSSTPMVDALGYATVAPVTVPAVVTLRGRGDAGADEWSTVPVDLDLVAGTLHTAFIVSQPLGSLGLVWCSDAATAASGPPTPCQIFDAPKPQVAVP
jgi:hypothetical protein